MRARLAVAAVTALALVLPAQALAGTASKSGATITVASSAGQVNRLTATIDGVNVRIAETGSGAALTAGTGCISGGTNQVLCPTVGTTLISMTGSDNDDWLTNSTSIAGNLDGGTDDDLLTGGTGADSLTGGGGSDYASYATRAGAVTADLDGLADDGAPGENDTIATDVETLIGGNANDTLTGNGNDNGLDGGPGADTLNGGAGNDYALYWTRTAAVNVSFDGVANDGEPGENDVLGSDVESVIGGGGNDTLTGNAADNNLVGWDGDDTLDGRGGADNLWGVNGNDTASYAAHTAAVSVTLDDAAGDGATGENDNAATENVIGGTGADTLTGGTGPNSLNGGPGADVLDGGAANDALAGGTGTDRVTYATRANTVTADIDGAADDGEGGEGDNIATDVENLTGGTGADTLTGDADANVLDGGANADVLNGGGGTDTATYASRTAAITADIDGTADDGEAGEGDNIATDVENLTGGTGADTLTGDADANVLDGGANADVLNGGGGTDTATYASRTAAITADIDGTADDGESGEGDNVATDVENLTGGTGADTLTGSSAVNRLTGGPGADIFHARDGANDHLSCGSEADTVTADPGDAADADCEAVDTGPKPAAPAPTATATAKAKAKKLKLSSAPITLDKNGRAPVTIVCPKSQVGGCAGTVTIEVAAEPAVKGKVKTSRRSRRRKVIGKARFRVSAGKKTKIRVRLSRRGRRKVLRKRRVRCRVSVANKGQDGKLVTTKQTLSLKAPKLKVKK